MIRRSNLYSQLKLANKYSPTKYSGNLFPHACITAFSYNGYTLSWADGME